MILKTVVLILCSFLVYSSENEVEEHIPWQGGDFFFASRGIPVATLLRDMGANYQVPVVVSDKIQDVFVGRVENKSPERVLDDLANLYHLAWYYNNRALYIYKAYEVVSEVMTPVYLPTSKIESYLYDIRALGIGSCRLVKIKGIQAFEVIGVPACVSKVSELAHKFDEKAEMQANNRQIARIFPLKYASATDSTYTYRGTQVSIPGVVTILKQMASQQTNQAKIGEDDLPQIHSQSAKFSADPRQNAVIIHDRISNMSLYSVLIPKLDTKPVQIQIAATIVDVDASELDDLGVDWSFSKKLSINTNFTQPASTDPFTSLIYDTSSFMVTLRALEKVSKAKILSQPSVITLNNIQAVLDSNATFYTKLEGQEEVKLEAITSGSLLRVTPRLIKNKNQQEVLLVLNIQDGSQDNTTLVDGLPQVTNAEISTQASLKSGQSLLLGGFIKDTQRQTIEKIPLLGDLPGLGYLFQSRSQENSSVVRLFLISAQPVLVAKTTMR